MSRIRKASKQIIGAVKLMNGDYDDVHLRRFIESITVRIQDMASLDLDEQRMYYNQLLDKQSRYYKQILAVVLSELKTRPVEEVMRNLERAIQEVFEND